MDCWSINFFKNSFSSSSSSSTHLNQPLQFIPFSVISHSVWILIDRINSQINISISAPKRGHLWTCPLDLHSQATITFLNNPIHRPCWQHFPLLFSREVNKIDKSFFWSQQIVNLHFVRFLASDFVYVFMTQCQTISAKEKEKPREEFTKSSRNLLLNFLKSLRRHEADREPKIFLIFAGFSYYPWESLASSASCWRKIATSELAAVQVFVDLSRGKTTRKFSKKLSRGGKMKIFSDREHAWKWKIGLKSLPSETHEKCLFNQNERKKFSCFYLQHQNKIFSLGRRLNSFFGKKSFEE